MQKKFIYAFWLLIFILITYFAHLYLQSKNNAQLTPITARSNQNFNLVQLKTFNNHYQSFGFINNHKVRFLLDTGASSVSIPSHIANEIGLKQGFPYQASTVNGKITVYHTSINHLRIGSIELSNVRASINPNSHDDFILLGMSALKHLVITQKQGTLTLKQYR